MATYLQNPNAQSYQFQPYELPVQQIASSIASRSNQWEIAASQVKSAYEQAAGLSLSRGESKEALKDFMIKADDMVRKTSRSDLSIGDNKVKALNIFKPLYQDQKLMLDHSLTEFYQNQNALAESAKLRDGGKEYSSDNARYMQEKYNEFISDPNYDVNTLQKHYNDKRGYTPYYDYNPEFDNIVKNCKAGQYTSQSPAVDKNGNSTLYFNVTTDKSLLPSKLAGCLSTGLSAKAKTQMGIEGYLAYGKNYNGLATDYIQYSDGELASYNKEKGAIDGRLQALREKPNLTDNEKLELSQLDQTSKQYGDYINDQIKTRDAIAGGNLDFIKNNYEKLAAPLYQSKKIQQFAQYHQVIDHTEKLEENNAAMLQYKETNNFTMMAEKFKQERARDAQNFVYDKELEGIRQAGRLAVAEANDSGDGSTKADNMGRTGVTRVKNADGTYSEVISYPASNGVAREGNQVDNNKQVFDDRYTAAVTAKDRADEFIFNSFKNKFPQYKDSKSLLASTEFQNYIHTNPKHPDIQAWGTAVNKAGKDMVRMEALKMDVEARLRDEIPEAFNPDLRGTRPISLPDGTVLSPQRMTSVIMGTDPEVRIVREQSTGRQPGMGGAWNVQSQSTEPVMYYKNQRYPVTGEALEAYQKIAQKARPSIDKIEGKRNELFGSMMLQLEGRRNIGNDNFNKKNTFKNRLSASLGVKPDQVVLNESNMTGDVWVKLTDDEKSKLPEDPLSTLVNGYQVTKDGDMYKFSQVEEYSFFSPNSYYKDVLTDVSASLKVNSRKLAQDKPVEIPIMTRRDAQDQSVEPTFKLIVKRGPSNENMFSLSKKGPDGKYSAIPQPVRNETEALALLEMMDQ